MLAISHYKTRRQIGQQELFKLMWVIKQWYSSRQGNVKSVGNYDYRKDPMATPASSFFHCLAIQEQVLIFAAGKKSETNSAFPLSSCLS